MDEKLGGLGSVLLNRNVTAHLPVTLFSVLALFNIDIFTFVFRSISVVILNNEEAKN